MSRLVTRRRYATVVACALLAAALVGAPGCSSGPAERVVPTTLGRDAKVFLDYGGKRGYEEVLRDEDGALRLPVQAAMGASYTERVRVEEPRKPVLEVILDVLVDPRPKDEDAIHLRSTVNALVVKTRRDSVHEEALEEALVIYQDPLAELKDPHGGPWFLPPGGQGLVLLCERADLALRLQDQRHALTPRAGGGALPLVVERRPGPVELTVEAPGYQPLRSVLTVTPGRFQVVTVRLAKER